MATSSASVAREAKYKLENYDVTECPVTWTPLVQPVTMPCCEIEIEKEALLRWKEACERRLEGQTPCPYCVEDQDLEGIPVDGELQRRNMIALYLNPQKFSELDPLQLPQVLEWWRLHRAELDKVDRAYSEVHGKAPAGQAFSKTPMLVATMGLPWSLFPGVGVPGLNSHWVKSADS